MPEVNPFPTLKPTAGRVLIHVARTTGHAHKVAGTNVTLELPTGIGECADPGSGVAQLLATHVDGPSGFCGFTVFYDPYALDDGRHLGDGCYIVNETDLYAVQLADGTVQALGKWILGEAVSRPERKTASGLILPALRTDFNHEERNRLVISDTLRGVMRVRSLGAAALPEHVGHEQRRVWGNGPVAYFQVSKNGADSAHRRRMNGREYLLLRYADVAGIEKEPTCEVVPAEYVNDPVVRVRPMDGGEIIELATARELAEVEA